MIRDNLNKTWKSGVVLQKESTPRSYRVQDEQGRIYRRNSILLKHSPNKLVMKDCSWDSAPTPETINVNVNPTPPCLAQKNIVTRSDRVVI